MGLKFWILWLLFVFLAIVLSRVIGDALNVGTVGYILLAALFGLIAGFAASALGRED